MNIKNLINKHIQKLVPYQSARRIGGHGHTFLNANEYPKSDLYFFNSTTLNRYPDCQPEEVVTGFADYVSLKRDHVLVSRGSDEAIGLIIRTFVEAESEGIVIAPPTYGMYEVAAHTNNVQVAYAERHDDFTLDADLLIDAVKKADFKVKAIFIDSPANPLGIIFDESELKKLLTALPEVLVVLDEAYIEFAPKYDAVSLVNEYDNLIVTRTLSKAFALAGIRCGFTCANPEIIAAMLKVIDPYPVCDPVAQIARQALAKGGIELMRVRVAETIRRRDILDSALRSLPFVKKIHPSNANYLLVEFADGPKVFDAMAQKGVILRSFDNKKGLKNCIRISVGSDEELEELMRYMSAIS